MRRADMGSSNNTQNTNQKKRKSQINIVGKGNKEMANASSYHVAENRNTVESNVTIHDIRNNKKIDHMKDHENDCYSPLHGRYGAWHNNLKLLKKKGIVPKYGKWGPDEIAKLEKNMKNYLDEHHVKDISRLIYPRTKEERKFRRSTQFILRMCYGIRRMRVHIAFKVESHFSSFLHKGRFTEQEKLEFKKLHQIHGNKWRHIGLLMNRVYHGMPLNYNRLFTSSKKGSWTKDEDERLIKAVNSCLERNSDVTWKAVSQIVGTRFNDECRHRWYSKCIQTRINVQSEDVVLGDKDIFKMIKIISESNVEDFYLIDWMELAVHFNSSVSANFLKWKFGVISKEVPHSHLLEFEDLIEQLYVIYSTKISETDSSSTIVIVEDESITDRDNVIVIDN